jgi:SAM-dependent methyltransferase
VVDLTVELLSDLHELGLSAFVAYGTLLGAVREGRLIGHDTDVDVAYYSRHEHPADVMRESFTVQRRLAARGWRVVRRSGAMLQVRGAGARSPKIDVFTAYHCDGWFAVEKWVRGRLPRSALLPLGEVTLEGRTFPAPGEPEALLALTYGDGWRVPDPTFTFDYSGPLRRRSEAWFGGWRRGLVHWRGVHSSSRPAQRGPSSFARYVDAWTSSATTVVDVGCGTGTDAVWLAREGRRVVGLDYVPTTVARARRHARRHGATARFDTLSLYDLRAVLAGATQIALTEPDVVITARHVLNALRPDGRNNLWMLAKIALGGGGLLHLELLTGRRADGSPRPVGAPFVTDLDPDEVVAEVTARGGRVVHRDDLDDEGRQVCRLAVAFAGERR